MVPEDVSHLCVCQTCHIWSLRSWNQHHHWIHIEKWFPKMYHTCVCQTCHMRSLWSWNWHHHWIHIKKRSPKMMRTPWGLHGDSTRLWRDYHDFWAGYAKSMRSPWGVHGNVWETVKYRIWATQIGEIHPPLIFMMLKQTIYSDTAKITNFLF